MAKFMTRATFYRKLSTPLLVTRLAQADDDHDTETATIIRAILRERKW